MKITDEEKSLLEKFALGALDGLVGDDLTSSGGSRGWAVIKNGMPARYKQGPGGKFFNGKENEHIEGVLHTLDKWVIGEEKLEFWRKSLDSL